MADGQWLRNAQTCARILGTWRPMVRRWPTSTLDTATLSYDFCGFNLKIRKRLTTSCCCGSASSYCARISVNPVAPSASATILSHPSSCFSSAAIRLSSIMVAGKGGTVARRDSTSAARSVTTVRGGGERHEQTDGRGGARRIRMPKRLNR